MLKLKQKPLNKSKIYYWLVVGLFSVTPIYILFVIAQNYYKNNVFIDNFAETSLFGFLLGAAWGVGMFIHHKQTSNN